MLMALIDLIDEESDVRAHAAEVLGAAAPRDALDAGVRLTRVLQERCGDVIGALFAASGVEPELTDAVAEGRRRHRRGARVTVERIVELGGLRLGLPSAHAVAPVSSATAYDGWRELVRGSGLSWDEAEALLADALASALLAEGARSLGGPGR
jgi:hypothetical protein